jgi:hypothetical protein
MREELLQFVWKYRKLPVGGLFTTSGKPVKILHNGQHNIYSGPDFFNAKLEIGGQLWAGNVEIHVNASDWYHHGHQEDPQYTNVILHVVWEEDTPVYLYSGTAMPTLQLKSYIPVKLLRSYRRLFAKNRSLFINCEHDVMTVDKILIANWLDRLYIERLERKSAEIETLLTRKKNDWENVLFILLLKNFGLNVNGEVFMRLGLAIDFRIIRKMGNDLFRLESLFFGQSGLLGRETVEDKYLLALQHEYDYLKKLYTLKEPPLNKPEFAKLRPSNFPSIRLAQFAALYAAQPALFSRVVTAGSLDELYSLFAHTASSYWNTHYDFGKASRFSRKKVSKGFIQLLLVNTIFPLRFCHARKLGVNNEEHLLHLLSGIPAEKNSVIENFRRLGLSAGSARESQALLQLHKEYCTANRCLHCTIGCSLLDGK